MPFLSLNSEDDPSVTESDGTSYAGVLIFAILVVIGLGLGVYVYYGMYSEWATYKWLGENGETAPTRCIETQYNFETHWRYEFTVDDRKYTGSCEFQYAVVRGRQDIRYDPRDPAVHRLDTAPAPPDRSPMIIGLVIALVVTAVIKLVGEPFIKMLFKRE